MFDGWEAVYGCVRREWGDLAGYRRVFGKKSIKNWGTREQPGLTLNLEKFDPGACRGVAFEFANNGADARTLLDYLANREACASRILPVLISGQEIIQTHVYIYEGKNVLDSHIGLTERAAIVVNARGDSGACFDYVRRTFEGLASIGIDDPEVTALWNAVCDLKSTTKQA
jgi:glutathione-specific gamma-glutamylcyclotransferase